MGMTDGFDFYGEKFKPELVSGIILKKLVCDAKKELGEIEGAVITVPAIFGESERAATKAAAEIAGLNVIGIIEEPVAAAIAYGLNKENSTYLVFDLGGGTFDISVMRKQGDNFTMLRTDGDRRLGGTDWDKDIAKYMAAQFKAEHGEDPYRDVAARSRLRQDAEELKKSLSKVETSRFSVTYHGKETRGQLTRLEFEELTKANLNLTEKTTQLVVETLQKNGEIPSGWAGIDRVLLVGGSTRMPMVRRMIERISGQKPEELDVDLIVSRGAALYAVMQTLQVPPDQKENETVKKLDVPDAFREKMKATKALRVCSFAIGIKVKNRSTEEVYNDVLIKPNTLLPFMSAPEEYATDPKGSRSVELAILEGESKDVTKCKLLGHGILELAEGSEPGAPVTVQIGLDTESSIAVTGIQKSTGRGTKFVLKREAGMNSQEVHQDTSRLSKMIVS